MQTHLDPLNPWGPPKKKKKSQDIAGFFKRKSEAEVEQEREINDACSAQVRLEKANRATAVQQKLDLLVTKCLLKRQRTF